MKTQLNQSPAGPMARLSSNNVFLPDPNGRLSVETTGAQLGNLQTGSAQRGPFSTIDEGAAPGNSVGGNGDPHLYSTPTSKKMDSKSSNNEEQLRQQVRMMQEQMDAMRRQVPLVHSRRTCHSY